MVGVASTRAQSGSGPGKKLVPQNLALNKPATASGSQDGHAPAHAVDGDTETRWCAPDGGNGYWWQVDLQKADDVTGCRISWETDQGPYVYKIEGSSDAKVWKLLAEETNGKRPQIDDHKFSAAGIRYVRVTVSRTDPGSWASFFECEVFGKTMMEQVAGAKSDVRLAEVKVPAGFTKTIFVAPTNISYPTCIAADPSGQVFVGVDQNGSLDVNPDRGWVVRCLDTDGDGVADKFNVFAKMDSPRGIVYDHNTLYVMHPPFLEAYYDDNGTGTANRSEILVSGLARDLKFRGADHTCNGVRMGIDGWLYIALGDYGALHAVAKDGSSLQVHGGGIVRVRPDGSDLELVVQGTRNIYDVAIDPLMNIYTCDNTNDGDDWNVRLSHMIPTGRYGYPSLFRHFSDEMMPTMVDYGGGSPTGSLFLDEPGFPGKLGYGLYTCQWGWSTVTRHPLESDGGTFKAGREDFISMTRPTGIDADGMGNVFAASWKGATFNFAGPNVGYVTKISPPDNHPEPWPNLEKITAAELLKQMSSLSAVRRLHVQREILRRGERLAFASGLEVIAGSNASLPVQVAAIFTLKQLLGAEAGESLSRLVKNDRLRPYALKALADRKSQGAKVSSKIFIAALSDKDPVVRREAVIGLNRLGRTDALAAILPLVADADIAVSHVAFRALVDLDGAAVCLGVLDQQKATLVPGATRVLRNLHEAKVVDGLLERLRSADMAVVRQPILETLCRLYYLEADWDGSWWSTRPDTSGPFFKWTTWQESEKIGQALIAAISKADDSTLKALLTAFQLNKLDIPGMGSTLLQLAGEKPQVQPALVEMFGLQKTVSKDGVAFLEKVALDGKAEQALRNQAFEGLSRNIGQAEVLDAAVDVLTKLGTSPKDAAMGRQLRKTFSMDRRHARNAAYFQQLTTNENSVQQELAYTVLLQLLSQPAQRGARGAQPGRITAQQAVDAGFKSKGVAGLLQAIGETHATNYSARVISFLSDSRAEVAAAAKQASVELGLESSQTGTQKRDVIANLAYAGVVDTATKTPGDPKVGAQLFEKLFCVKCHTTSKAEPLKGPYLGDISTRYGRPEILESILKPNAQIAQGFVSTTIETKDGNEFEGFVVKESGDELEIRNLAGANVIAKKDITKRGTKTTSIMPEGLADQITPQELASLVTYLQSLK